MEKRGSLLVNLRIFWSWKRNGGKELVEKYGYSLINFCNNKTTKRR